MEAEEITGTIVIVPTANMGLVYNGEEQRGVLKGEGYALEKHKQTVAGTYTVIATLVNDTDTCYKRSDGTTLPRLIVWSIEKKKLIASDVAIRYVYVRALATSVNYENQTSGYLYLGTFKIERNKFYWNKVDSGAWSSYGLDNGWANLANYAKGPRSSDTAYIRRDGATIDLGNDGRPPRKTHGRKMKHLAIK